LSTNTQVKDKNISLEDKAKSYRQIAEECFEPDDLVNDKLAFSLLSSTPEWVRLEEAQKLEVELEQANAHVESLQGIVKWRAEELEQAKQEVKLWKKNRNIYVEKKNKLTEQIANAKQILEEYGCGDCTPAVLLREVLK
jgi:hypothetical protein